MSPQSQQPPASAVHEHSMPVRDWPAWCTSRGCQHNNCNSCSWPQARAHPPSPPTRGVHHVVVALVLRRLLILGLTGQATSRSTNLPTQPDSHGNAAAVACSMRGAGGPRRRRAGAAWAHPEAVDADGGRGRQPARAAPAEGAERKQTAVARRRLCLLLHPGPARPPLTGRRWCRRSTPRCTARRALRAGGAGSSHQSRAATGASGSKLRSAVPAIRSGRHPLPRSPAPPVSSCT